MNNQDKHLSDALSLFLFMLIAFGSLLAFLIAV
jgi:hypothetical protein